MKNAKRILALIAAVLLFGMYLSTLIFALIGSPHSIDLLWASVACTIVLPVLLYGYMLVFRLTQHDIPSDDPTDTSRTTHPSLLRLTTMQAMIPCRTQRASDFLRDRLSLFSYVFFHLL